MNTLKSLRHYGVEALVVPDCSGNDDHIKRAARKAERILPSGNYPPWKSITLSPYHTLHTKDTLHNAVFITSSRIARECIQDSHVNGAGPPFHHPGMPRDPEPPNTKARSGHSSSAVRAILNHKCPRQEKGRSQCRQAHQYVPATVTSPTSGFLQP